MNKRNMERYHWVLCPSKTFPGKFYYFNVHSGEAAWNLSEIENARAMQKNNYIQKVNKWLTYPEPDGPPDEPFGPEPSWWRKPPEQCLFSRPTKATFGQPALPVYHSYMEPHLPNAMQNPTPMGSVFLGDMKRHTTDLHNMWGCERDLYFLNTDKNNRYERFEKPGMFNMNYAPIKSQWSYMNNYQKNSTIPVFGQNLSKTTPMFEPKPGTNIIKEPTFRRTRTHSDPSFMDNEVNLFRTKTIDNLRSFDDSAYFDQTRPLEKTSTKFTPKSSVFQTGRIFGIKSFEDLKTLDDSGCFEMPKTSAVQKNVFVTEPDRNIRITKHISNENVCCSESLMPRKRQQSALSGEEKADNKNKMNKGKMDEKKDLPQELAENDLRYILMAKRKKSDNPQVRTGNKIKTSYTPNGNVGTPVKKKRVTFDTDYHSGDDDEKVLGDDDDDQQEYNKVIQDEQACEEALLDVKALKKLAKPQTQADAWYIVVDTETLLEDFEFIESFVQGDSQCRLLVPPAIRRQLGALTGGDCRGRRRVLAARHLARRIASPPEYITVQVAEECSSEMSVSESILNCCLRAMDQKYHVVLITNDAALFKKANLIDIPCFMLQEIKDGASAPKPEISFNIRKIVKADINNDVGRKSQCLSASSSANQLSNSNIPVNCFKKRLFDVQNIENNEDKGLFFQNDERNLTCLSRENLKTTKSTKVFADCENFQPNGFFPPKNYRNTAKDESDISTNTSEIRQIRTDIQNLVIKEAPRDMGKDMWLAKPGNGKGKPKIAKEPEVSCENEASTKERNDEEKKNNLKSVNGYNIEQHLKKFDVKTKIVEDRIKARMDEWICSFSQIMEDVLTDTLQEYSAPGGALAPPWTLAEAVECVRDKYGHISSVRAIVERLSTLLFNCSCKKGKLRLDMKPKDFMTIFGLGILLIQCLKNVTPTQRELCTAEDALVSLMRLASEPGAEPAPPEPAPAPPAAAAADHPDRKNFVKKPSEVIEYLKRHYPEWKSYKEAEEPGVDQLKEKDKHNNKIVRTFGKNLQNVKIKNNRSISLTKSNNDKTSTKKDEHFHSNDVQKVDNTKLDETGTENADDKAIKVTGAKLLRKLAINSLHKIPTLQDINVERRDKCGIELMNMIDNMIGITNEHVTEQTTFDINDENNNTNNINRATNNNEPKFIRTFNNFTIRKIDLNYNDDKNKATPSNDAPKENSNDTKHESPKIIRHFNVMLPKTDENDKSNEKLDLDALDYDIDYNEKDDTSQMTVDNDEEAEATYEEVVNNHEEEQNNEESPQNDEANGEEQNNENIETDTTNDSGFENDSLYQAYLFAKTFLAELSETLKFVYSFVSSAANKFAVGRVGDDTKMALNQRASVTRKSLAEIIDSLKRIIERESDERTSFKAALIRAGVVEASNDKRITLYKQVASKYLEQARILREALQAVMAATAPPGGHSPTPSQSPDIKYINIFE